MEDLEQLVQIERACAEAPHCSDAVWRSLLEANGDGLRCVLVAGEAGFVVLGGYGEVAELESVVVAPEQRRHGLARALCLAAMQWARAHGARTMMLEVRAGNGAARSLYASLGFVEQGVRKGYYREPVEDAVLLSARLMDEG